MFVLPAVLVGFFAMPIIFWTFIAVSFGCLVWATESETFVGSTLALLAIAFIAFTKFAVGSDFVFDLKLFCEVIAGVFFGNALLGVFWSYFKWNLFVSDKIAAIKSYMADHSKEETAVHYCGWNEGRNITHAEILDSNFKVLTPQVRHNKKKITMWMIYCIPSILWFLLNDPIRRFANYIFESIKETFQGKANEKFDKAFN